MIVSHIVGGLGNQLFQYAIGRSLAIKNNTDFYIDTSSYPSYGLHNYSLCNFNILNDITNINKIVGIPFNIIRERGVEFHPHILQLKGNIKLMGYWQSEKYFKDIEYIIRKELTIKEELLNNKIKNLKEKISNKNSIFLHVRRTDFLTSIDTNKVHGVCSLDYYNKAIQLIREKANGYIFYIFSDDIGWCKQNFKGDYIFIEGNKDYEDFYLMYNCKHAITANSTFSWWSGYLINNPDKIIIHPKKWYNTSERNTCDLFPLNWIGV